jgi:hypothetical protein
LAALIPEKFLDKFKQWHFHSPSNEVIWLKKNQITCKGVKSVEIKPSLLHYFFEALDMYLVSQNIFAIKEKSFYVPTSFIVSPKNAFVL